MKNILDWIEEKKQQYEGHEPRTMAQEPRNMYAGGQLVQNTVDGSRPGYAEQKLKTGKVGVTIDGKQYRKITHPAHPQRGKISFITTKNEKAATEYLSVKELRERLKNKGSSTSFKEGQTEKITKKINRNITNWTKNWIKNNQEKYGVRKYSDFQNNLAKAWAKELKNNPNKYKGSFGVGLKVTNDLGLPNVRSVLYKTGTDVAVIDGIQFPQRPIRVGSKPELTFQKVFYKNKLKNAEFKSKVNQYLEWTLANKKVNAHLLDPNVTLGGGAQSKTLALEYGKKFRGFDDDVVHFMGEVLNNTALNPGGGQTGINDVFKNVMGKNADAYFKKYQGSWGRWINNFYDVAKLAGLNETQAKAVLQKQKDATQKIMKLYNVKKLPLEFMVAQDHIMGLAEAKALGDPKIAGQTLNNLIASTREQNRVLGQEGFSNRRVKLMKDFKAAPKNARQPIVNKINALADEFVPGRLRYDVKKDGSLKVTNLQPEKTLKSRVKGYETLSKEFPKKIQKILGNKVTSKEAGFISTAMLENFGKLGLKGGKLLKWLQLEYDVLFEGLIYQYHRQYEGQEPEVAREALWLPKIIAKYAPDLWEKAGFEPFKQE